MDLKVLRSFVEIAREQSFTAAAEKLSVTQPTLPQNLSVPHPTLSLHIQDHQ